MPIVIHSIAKCFPSTSRKQCDVNEVAVRCALIPHSLKKSTEACRADLWKDQCVEAIDLQQTFRRSIDTDIRKAVYIERYNTTISCSQSYKMHGMQQVPSDNRIAS